VLTVTGHGLKDPQWALRTADGSDVTPTIVPVDTARIADVLGLVKASPASGAPGSSGGTAE
jgi:threonine synthase